MEEQPIADDHMDAVHANSTQDVDKDKESTHGRDETVPDDKQDDMGRHEDRDGAKPPHRDADAMQLDDDRTSGKPGDFQDGDGGVDNAKATVPPAGTTIQAQDDDDSSKTARSRQESPVLMEIDLSDDDDDAQGYQTPKGKYEFNANDTNGSASGRQSRMDIDKFGENDEVPPPPDTSAAKKASLDLVHKVQGMYRLLDLISEEGSAGVVEKVTMDAEGLKTFMETLYPGAYKSMNRVDFRALDTVALHPVGVYGSKSEIVRFLKAGGKIDDETTALLIRDQSDGAIDCPRLRSGLYVVHSIAGGPDGTLIYVIYWPEDTTWDDDAGSTVKRNRVTFMRYLTKLCSQLIAYIAPEHSSKLVWADDSDDEEDDEMDGVEDNSRLISFQVKKTSEQEDSVEVLPGFKFRDLVLQPAARMSPVATDLTGDYGLKVIAGEVQQAVLTAKFNPGDVKTSYITKELWYGPRLTSHVRAARRLKINDSIDDEGIRILLDHGLREIAPDVCAKWQAASARILEARNKEINDKTKITRASNEETRLRIVVALQMEAVDFVRKHYDETLSALVFEHLRKIVTEKAKEKANKRKPSGSATYAIVVARSSPATSSEVVDAPAEGTTSLDGGKSDARPAVLTFDEDKEVAAADWKELVKASPELEDTMRELRRTEWESILGSKSAYIDLKARFTAGVAYVAASEDLDDADKAALSSAITSGRGAKLGSKFEERKGAWALLKSSVKNLFGLEIKSDPNDMSSADFIAFVKGSASRINWLAPVASAALDVCAKTWADIITTRVRPLSHRGCDTAERGRVERLKREAGEYAQGRLDRARHDFLNEIGPLLPNDNGPALVIFRVKDFASGKSYSASDRFEVDGRIETPREPTVEYTVHFMGLTASDQASIRSDNAYTPSPRLVPGNTSSFRLPLGTKIKHIQVTDDKIILITEDAMQVSIFVEKRMAICNAVELQRAKRIFQREKLHPDALIAYDETSRLLVVLSAERDRCIIHVFAVDDKDCSVRSRGSPVDVFRWFEPTPSIAHICMVAGSLQEEICIIEHSGRCRIFSLVSESCRPGVVQLPGTPRHALSSPDGSCLIVIYEDSGATAYHWDRFGSSEGFLLDLPDFLNNRSAVLTSLVSRTCVHLLGVDVANNALVSNRLKIQKRTSEFHLRKEQAVRPSDTPVVGEHNCLVDCLSEVWTRFPVVPAIGQDVFSIGHAQARILYVSDHHRDRFQSHFSAMVRRFERTTRKPTQRVLDKISIDSTDFDTFISVGITWPVSCVRAGEWIIQCICLVPLQIAIARDNRFLPLKDGLWSSSLEQQTLGSSVMQVANNITFGWYESIFTHYDKPVKVVSSMGEQSTGKSFMLAHLADTSFAGSAMRCTEGVWMCVTPTNDTLFVALDFEGVHSLERSVQEDALLVLFNAAISNMILFRNNFAISRNIAGMFTSFQSSSSLFDPEANPTLFQSCLVIVIKDVVDADTDGIVQEFEDKFQRIVADEQEANFLTRLHRGQLRIVPWPVIESKKYYTAYNRLKHELFKQPISHQRAGAFLHTMKTLMAKIKACDWGALDQNLAAHRADQMRASLRTALVAGLDDNDEPLKDLDSATFIPHGDTPAVFYLASPTFNLTDIPELREATLLELCAATGLHLSRQDVPDHEWLALLRARLDNIIDARIARVRDWASVNTARFEGHADIQQFNRLLDAGVVELRDGIALCGTKCGECQLLCTASKRHLGPHTCHTAHVCKHICSFSEDHEEDIIVCGLPAGHAGNHMCEVGRHLCGRTCAFAGKPGCLGGCMKAADHTDEEHACSARVHGCGELCALATDGLCSEPCAFPHDEPHEIHNCRAKGCPYICELCKRLCSSVDHFHGRAEGVTHLCGQEHPCNQACSSEGYCEVSTDPIAVETTFTGRHDNFQFTKYSQNVKRNICAVPIPAGEKVHQGPHAHDVSAKPFHYCTSRCPSCGYVCNLPFGHAQPEHETAHGSMSNTEWAVEDPDAAFEVEGHRFGSRDSGAPMLCSVYCSALGRHAHIDYCKTPADAYCGGQEYEHIPGRLNPNPEKAKDFVTHALFWRRSGFKDPYSREEQTAFAQCDAMCAAPEHLASGNNPAQPSFCTLPIFHAPQPLVPAPATGYISNDGHTFACANPAVTNQSYHIIFVGDKSGSMGSRDKLPLAGTPTTNLIMRHAPNRLGAVFSSVHGLWIARQGTGTALRRDAYSVVLFDHYASTYVENDLTSTPENLLNALVVARASGGTNFDNALQHAQTLMETHWSVDRSPVIIFLSDGECGLTDNTVIDLCRRATVLGKPLAFHAVSFGQNAYAGNLNRMATLARDVYRNAPGAGGNADAQCTFTTALDTVRLAETFIGIADSLKKPRAALIRSGK